MEEAFAAALAPHGGPTFVDFPLDYVFMEAPEELGQPAGSGEGEAVRRRRAEAQGADGAASARARTAAAIERAAELLREAERPVIMAGTDLYWGHGEQALLELAETLRIPVFLNGLARGCVAADHELFFSRSALAGAEGLRRGAGGGRADGLPARLRRRRSARRRRSS